MEPTLRDGDWLLVDPDAFRDLQPSSGDLVVVAAEPWLVKRVLTVAADGQLALRGDHAAHADEAVAMPLSAVRGRPWFRYWPPRRMGRV